jgi:hypothetical protein
MADRTIRRHHPMWLAALALILALPAGCCRGAARAVDPIAAESGPPPLAFATPDAARADDGDAATRAEFRNVNFHLAPGLVLGIRRLSGDLVSRTPGEPVVFDDKTSFAIRLVSAEVALDTASLERLMNDYVFAYRGAPLRAMRFSTAGSQLRLSGILHKVVDIPFELTATVSVTDSGMIRVHPTSMKICTLDGKGLMDALGIELADLLDVRKARGVRVDHDDLLLDPDHLLPPPEIRGRVTAVRVEPGQLVQVFGDVAAAAALPAIAPPDTAAPNYMYFRRGTLRFGKLFMVEADMQIVDLEASTPFEFSIDRYNEQLVAGYSRNHADLGLEVFMPDVTALPSPAPAPATAARPRR